MGFIHRENIRRAALVLHPGPLFTIAIIVGCLFSLCLLLFYNFNPISYISYCAGISIGDAYYSSTEVLLSNLSCYWRLRWSLIISIVIVSTIFVSVSMLLISYIYCIIVGPGRVPAHWKVDDGVNKDSKSQPGVTSSSSAPISSSFSQIPTYEYLQWCTKCQAYKAPRSHHCAKCGFCVLKLDHHCPWINSCVGHYNHKQFIQFLAAVVVSCSLCAGLHVYCGVRLVLYRLYPAYWVDQTGTDGDDALVSRDFEFFLEQSDESSEALFYYFFVHLAGFVFSLAVSIGCFVILYYQIKDILDNKTLIEDWIVEKSEPDGPRPNYDSPAKGEGEEMSLGVFFFPYDVGQSMNFRMVMGPSYWDWLYPFSSPLDYHPLFLNESVYKSWVEDYSKLFWGFDVGSLEHRENRANACVSGLGQKVLEFQKGLLFQDLKADHLPFYDKQIDCVLASFKWKDSCGQSEMAKLFSNWLKAKETPNKDWKKTDALCAKKALLPFCDGITWPILEGADQYTLTREQLRQKRSKRQRAVPMVTSLPTNGCKYLCLDQCWAKCVHWGKAKEQSSDLPLGFCTGCWGCCKAPCQIDFLDDALLRLEPGNEVLVTRFRTHWLYGEKKVEGAEVKDIDNLKPEDRKQRGSRGWFPRHCVYRKPHQD
eukprot:Nk52_evm5s217 gene=Nk52_evmTU5s217